MLVINEFYTVMNSQYDLMQGQLEKLKSYHPYPQFWEKFGNTQWSTDDNELIMDQKVHQLSMSIIEQERKLKSWIRKEHWKLWEKNLANHPFL